MDPGSRKKNKTYQLGLKPQAAKIFQAPPGGPAQSIF